MVPQKYESLQVYSMQERLHEPKSVKEAWNLTQEKGLINVVCVKNASPNLPPKKSPNSSALWRNGARMLCLWKAFKIQKRDHKPFKCDTYNKTFKRVLEVIIHKRTHTDERPYKCEKCGKAFHQHAHLKNHYLVHITDQEKPKFQCGECGKCYQRKKDVLVQDRVTHQNVRPFKCEVCGKRSTTRQHADQHTVMHTGKKPFKCDICGEAFIHKSGSWTHVMIHIGEICSKTFNNSGNLKTHSNKIDCVKNKKN